jgi:hypothetical protein
MSDVETAKAELVAALDAFEATKPFAPEPTKETRTQTELLAAILDRLTPDTRTPLEKAKDEFEAYVEENGEPYTIDDLPEPKPWTPQGEWLEGLEKPLPDE